MSTDSNRGVFDDARVAATYVEFMGPTDGFLDRGEAAALVAAADLARGVPVLDVGVGSGRTTPLLRLLSERYVAIDYAPNMIDAFRKNFPDLPAHVADARDLAAFEDGEFGLVVFSNNGLDTVTHEQRRRVLAEFARVTDETGVVVFSTLNRGGRSYLESPFQLRRPTTRPQFSLRALLVAVGRRLLDPSAQVRGVRNWLVNRSKAEDHRSWALAPLQAHEFALVMHFSTLDDVRTLVAGAGLELIAVYGDDGERIAPDRHESAADNFTVLAKKPALERQ